MAKFFDRRPGPVLGHHFHGVWAVGQGGDDDLTYIFKPSEFRGVIKWNLAEQNVRGAIATCVDTELMSDIGPRRRRGST